MASKNHLIKIAASNKLPTKATISKRQQIPPLTFFTSERSEDTCRHQFTADHIENGMYCYMYNFNTAQICA